ncbi:hypothetical protein HYE67_008842 [Fusarium culmorum]|uniref:DUF7492 domain-containing protein n=1 Tax=Fusarium culmorum TaxID=5516 RepID=A0A2T4H7E8_FUSCU|nr:hypothetical protein FCULG_00003547 [Fusarium culmorum]QPC66611.1 hypothetical protein HYE67_008842 [Fusarium culmorum]
MKFIDASALALAAGTLISPVSAHSWVEYASKLARNGTMIGKMGYPRGFVPRDSTNPPFADSIPQNILPQAGQSAYSGQEILNKYKLEKNPQFPMLEAAAGDYIAIMHLENGHTTLPENQPNKPKNRGTIYFYGTTQPKDEEKLFDVHLRWNKEGTGGDKRGKLISTRNYDDGQCYQPNNGQLSTGRSAELKPKGAVHEKELACQSDLKLPTDLKVGDIYTVYWYWDWPDLNKDNIDMEATKNGKFPWAGTFMRGEKDPNGFTMNAIARNESYSSVLDIKITAPAGVAAKDQNILEYVDNQNVYSAGIEEQMKSNFQVDVDGGKGGDMPVPSAPSDPSTPSSPSSPALPTATAPVDGGAGNGGDVATVTVTATVKPSPIISTVYVTVPSESLTTVVPEPIDGDTSTKTITTTALVTKSKNPSDAEPTPPTASTVYETLYTTRPKEQPTGGDQPQQPQPSTVIKTIVTHINTPSSSGEANTPPAQTTVPGGEFREAPPANGGAPAQTQSDGPPIPTPFLRRRQNWVFGNY